MYLKKIGADGTEEWNNAIDRNVSEDFGRSVQQTSDGGYILLGETIMAISPNNDADMYLVKTDVSGVPLSGWGNQGDGSSIFGVAGAYDAGYSVQQTADGGYILLGTTYLYGFGDDDIYLVKTDANGIEEWSTTIDRNGNNDDGSSVQQTADGGYIILGGTVIDPIPGDNNMYVVRTDASGVPVPGWGNQGDGSSIFGGADWSDGRSVQQTSDGGFMMAGYIQLSGTSGFSMYMVKTDEFGNALPGWGNRGDGTSAFGGISNDHALSARQTYDGGYILLGYTDSFGEGGNDMYLVRTDSNGVKVPGWGNRSDGSSTFGGSGSEMGRSVQQTLDGGYILLGDTDSYGAGGFDMYLVKTLPDGTASITFEETFGGNTNDFGRSVQQTTDGGYILLGDTDSFGAGASDLYLMKTDAYGVPVSGWGNRGDGSSTFGGAGSDYGYSVQQTTDGGYILLGNTTSFGVGASDMYLVKVGSDGIEEWNTTIDRVGSVDYGYSVQQTADGGYILLGATEVDLLLGDIDMYLVKTDSLGVPVPWWGEQGDGSSRFGGPTNGDYGYSVQQTADGGYVLAGTSSFETGVSNMYLVKTDANGIAVPGWGNQGDGSSSFGGLADYERGHSVKQTADGGYIVLGDSASGTTNDWNMYAVKTDAFGIPLPGWGNQSDGTSRFGGSSWTVGREVRQTVDGGYILAGHIYSFDDVGNDVYVVKTDASGNTVAGWGNQGDGTSRFGGAGNELARSVQQTVDGGYILLGTTDSFGSGGYDMYLVKTNVDGKTFVNTQPVADAGPDQAITLVGTVVQLDGTGSIDLEGDTLTYLWNIVSKPAGSSATLSNPASPTPTFVADINGDYTVNLTVSDGSLSSTDLVLISFSNVPPLADAGGNDAAAVGDIVTLDGSGSSDANGDPISYTWSIIGRPLGSTALLSSSTGVSVTLTPDRSGDYEVRLIVNDGIVDSAPSDVTITVVITQDALSGALITTVTTINNINTLDLGNKNYANPLTNKINAALKMIEKGQYASALDKLENDILGKTDGCASLGFPDENDWIINCTTQADVFQTVTEAIAYLKVLMAP
jgi:hypothetical protein